MKKFALAFFAGYFSASFTLETKQFPIYVATPIVSVSDEELPYDPNHLAVL